MNAVPLAESSSWPSCTSLSRIFRSESRRWIIATENATEVTALIATKVCALAAMSSTDTGPVMSTKGPRPVDGQGTRVPGRRRASRCAPSGGVKRAADHISSGSSRKATGCDGSAATQARAASDEQGEVADHLEKRTLPRWLGWRRNSGSSTARAPKWVSGDPQHRPPQVLLTAEADGAGGDDARGPAAQDDRDQPAEVVRPRAQLGAVDLEAGEPPEHDHRLDRVRDGEARPRRRRCGRPPGRRRGTRGATRRSSQRVVSTGGGDEEAGGERGGRPPPRHERRVRGLTQGVDRDGERGRSKTSGQQASCSRAVH